jgi:glycosyltransferase involved in cell wall biosynthesis
MSGVIPISVQILTKNSGKVIGRCLTGLTDFDEVLLCDNGSEDDTLTIAAEFSNVTIIKNLFIGFGPLRQLATGHARHDWILAVDSDEVVSPALCKEISKLDLSNPNNTWKINRRNHFNGRHIRGCGWSPDWITRLFNRNVTGYNDNLVHESVNIPKELTLLPLHEGLDHYPYNHASELIDKMQRYSDIYAQQHAGKRQVGMVMILLKTLAAFVKGYLLHGGIRDGEAGLLICLSNANGVFYKYIKLREKNCALRSAP